MSNMALKLGEEVSAYMYQTLLSAPVEGPVLLLEVPDESRVNGRLFTGVIHPSKSVSNELASLTTARRPVVVGTGEEVRAADGAAVGVVVLEGAQTS